MTAPNQPATLDLEAQIDSQERMVDLCETDYGRKMESAILASLRELQRIRSAERPEPVAWGCDRTINDTDGRPIGTDEPELSYGKYPPDNHGYWPLYGPELLDAYDRMAAERDDERGRGDQWELTATGLLNRAEAAEFKLAKVVEGLRECRRALWLVCHLSVDYDMNADPDSVTLKTGRAFALADSLLVDDDTELLRQVEGE